MIALIRRRFLRLLAGFGGAVATGAVLRPHEGRAQSPQAQEQEAKQKARAGEAHNKEQFRKKSDPRAKEKDEKEKLKAGRPKDPKAAEQYDKAHARQQETKAKEESAKKMKKGGSLFDEERLKKERLARLIVERHAKA